MDQVGKESHSDDSCRSRVSCRAIVAVEVDDVSSFHTRRAGEVERVTRGVGEEKLSGESTNLNIQREQNRYPHNSMVGRISHVSNRVLKKAVRPR